MKKSLSDYFGCELSDIENFEIHDGVSQYDNWYSFEIGEPYCAKTGDECKDELKTELDNRISNGDLEFDEKLEDWVYDNLSSGYYRALAEMLYEMILENYQNESTDEKLKRLMAFDVISEEDIDEDGNYVGDADIDTLIYELANDEYQFLLDDHNDNALEAYLFYTGDSIDSLVNEGYIEIDKEELADYIWDYYDRFPLFREVLGEYVGILEPGTDNGETYYLYKQI